MTIFLFKETYMSRNAFDQLEQEYNEREEQREMAAEERRRAAKYDKQQEKKNVNDTTNGINA
jgi:hypothetical protein